MRKELVIALRVTAVTLVLTGLVYPLVTTTVAGVLFPWRAGGSFVSDEHGRARARIAPSDPIALYSLNRSPCAYTTSPGASSVPASIDPSITESAPAAIASYAIGVTYCQ